MAGGFASSEGAPDFEQSAPNGNTGKLGRKRERMSVHKSNDAGQFSGFSMYFEHQELDESSYPNGKQVVFLTFLLALTRI